MSNIGVSGVTGCTGYSGTSCLLGLTGYSGIGGPTGVSGTAGFSGTSRPMYKCYHCDNLFWFEKISEIEIEDKSQVLCKSCCREYKIEELIEEYLKL